MPYAVAIFPEHQLGIVRFSDSVTGETILQAVRELCSSAKWKPEYHSLWDARQIGELVVSPFEVADILNQVRSLESSLAPGRTAAVVRSQMAYTLAQMFFVKGDRGCRERKVFYSVDEAIRWVRAGGASPENDTLLQKTEGFMSGLAGA